MQRLDKGQDQLRAAVNRGNRRKAPGAGSGREAQARAEKTRTVMILLDDVPRFSKALKIVIRFDNISQSEAHWVCPLTPVSISPSLIKGTRIGKTKQNKTKTYHFKGSPKIVSRIKANSMTLELKAYA